MLYLTHSLPDNYSSNSATACQKVASKFTPTDLSSTALSDLLLSFQRCPSANLGPSPPPLPSSTGIMGPAESHQFYLHTRLRWRYHLQRLTQFSQGNSKSSLRIAPSVALSMPSSRANPLAFVSALFVFPVTSTFLVMKKLTNSLTLVERPILMVQLSAHPLLLSF